MATPTHVPEVGALVEYGHDLLDPSKPTRWRVTGWMREAPKPVFRSDSFVDDIMVSILTEEAEADKKAGRVRRPRMQWCLPEEATHVTLYAVCGTIAPISEVKVTGMVDWPPEALKSERDLAMALGATHEISW